MTSFSLVSTLRGSCALCICLALSACGGSGGSSGGSGGEPAAIDPTAYTEISDRTSTVDTILVYVGTTNSGDLRLGRAGTLDHPANTITSGLLAGTTNNGRTTIMLSGGGLATLTNPEGTDYSRVFTTQGAGTPIFGVVGQQTGPSAMPDTGILQYNGSIAMTVADGADLTSLTGNATITASWADVDTVDLTFNGFRENGSSVGGSIQITDATISNSGYRGGTLSTTGAQFDVTDAASISGTRGYFFGPNAEEVGGTLLVDDTAQGSLEIIGVYSAN